MSEWLIVTMTVATEPDIVAVRQRAHRLAELLGFERQDQTRIATSVSEIARNAYSYGKGGRAEFAVRQAGSQQQLLITISDRGAGIADLDAVLEGHYRSPSGMGLGITGARRLLHHFKITSQSTGTTVELGHNLPDRAPRVTAETIKAVVGSLKQERQNDPLSILRAQNRELLESLEEIRRRQIEAEQLSHELADTNRGVVALYAELDARAEQLRQASEIKSRFLSNASHEFRTPLNSVMALSSLLLDGVDGELNAEQRRQIGYIRKSAQDLLDIVNDLLDLAKVEAGKVDLKDSAFTIDDLFGSLRGALKPLRSSAEVELVFESASELPALYTDEGKVTQILRNFISNALKFTERGDIHVSAHHDSRAQRVTFAVADTGIGIAAQDRERIFEEFTQVDGNLQKRSKGTGLGLPLSRQLAELLGGEVWVDSEPGRGSTFFLSIPLRRARDGGGDRAAVVRKRILLVDDDEMFRYVLRQILNEQHHYEVLEAVDGGEALQRIRDHEPDLVVLDLQMPGMDGFEVLRQLHGGKARLPVIISTSLPVDAELLARLPEAIPILSKDALSRDRVRQLLEQVLP